MEWGEVKFYFLVNWPLTKLEKKLAPTQNVLLALLIKFFVLTQKIVAWTHCSLISKLLLWDSYDFQSGFGSGSLVVFFKFFLLVLYPWRLAVIVLCKIPYNTWSSWVNMPAPSDALLLIGFDLGPGCDSHIYSLSFYKYFFCHKKGMRGRPIVTILARCDHSNIYPLEESHKNGLDGGNCNPQVQLSYILT